MGSLRLKQRFVHESCVRLGREPVLVGDGTLPEQHSQSVRNDTTAFCGGGLQGGGMGDDVIYQLTGMQSGSIQRQRIACMQPQTGGIHDEVGRFNCRVKVRGSKGEGMQLARSMWL